jgi:two-component sensor histidine kinase
MLVKEIHHRVKNNLQVISSLLNMHVRKVEDPGSKRIFDEGISRIQAMSLIHQTIYQQENLQQLQPKAYIERLVQQLYQTYQVSEKQIKVRTDIADVELDIEKLMALGLILNEILSNAFKYAFEGKEEGTVKVSLQKLSTHRLELRVKDDGVGMPLTEVDARQEDSLGLKLVRAFSRKLGGELRINSENGTEYQIAFDSGV